MEEEEQPYKLDSFHELDEQMSDDKTEITIDDVNDGEREKYHLIKKINGKNIVPLIEFKESNSSIISREDPNGKINEQKIIDVVNLNNIHEGRSVISVCEESDLMCQVHLNQEFAYYCDKCLRNLCRECVRTQEHQKESLQVFDILIRDIIKEDKIKYIENYMRQNESVVVDMKNFTSLMNIIIEDYKNFPNFSHFFIINHFFVTLGSPKVLPSLKSKKK